MTFANDFRFPIPFPNDSLKANIKENSPCNRNKNPVLSHQRFGLFSRTKQSAHLSQKIKRTTNHPNPRTVVLWPLVNSHPFLVPSEIEDFVNPCVQVEKFVDSHPSDPLALFGCHTLLDSISLNCFFKLISFMSAWLNANLSICFALIEQFFIRTSHHQQDL